MRLTRCCICGCEFEGHGNNPDGAMWHDKETNELIEFKPEPGDRCCNDCDNTYVIPGRIFKMKRGMK